MTKYIVMVTVILIGALAQAGQKTEHVRCEKFTSIDIQPGVINGLVKDESGKSTIAEQASFSVKSDIETMNLLDKAAKMKSAFANGNYFCTLMESYIYFESKTDIDEPKAQKAI